MRFYLGRRLPLGFYGGMSFRGGHCQHCGQAQPFNWPAFWFGVVAGLVLLALAVKALA